MEHDACILSPQEEADEYGEIELENTELVAGDIAYLCSAKCVLGQHALLRCCNTGDQMLPFMATNTLMMMLFIAIITPLHTPQQVVSSMESLQWL